MSFWAELRKRNVIRVGLAYLIVAWLVIQIVSAVSNPLRLPEWFETVVLVLLAVGFPIALVLAWAYEITPDGVKPAQDNEAATPANRKSRVFSYLIIAALAVAVGWLLFERNLAPPQDSEAPKSVAVLPFDDLSPQGDQGWFTDGLTEEILNSLARLPELKVISRTSSFHFRNRDVPLREIASQLGVGHIVEGSVRRSGDQLRVTAQLIRAADDSHIWSANYDASSKDVFRVQEDVAENVAAALNVFLDDDKREAMFAVGTRDVEAYEHYLQGVKLYHEWHGDFWRTDRIWQANAWFDKALQADPEFALVYYLRANAYAHFLFGDFDAAVSPDLTYAEALAALRDDYRRAAELVEDPAQKLIFEIHQNFFSDDWGRLPSLLDQIDFDGVQYTRLASFQWLPQILITLGRGNEAFALSNDARQRSPLDTTPWADTVAALRSIGDSEKALDYVRAAETQFGWSFDYLKLPILIELGRADEAVEEIVRANHDSVPPLPLHALALAAAGRRDEAQSIIESLLARSNRSPILVGALLAMGDRQAAESLTRSIDSRPGGAQLLVNGTSHTFGGKLAFDLAWAPNFAERSAEAMIRLEPWPGLP